VQQVSKDSIFKQNYVPDFKPPPRWMHRAEGFWGQMDYPSSDILKAPKRTLILQIDFDGSGHLFCGRAADREPQGTLSVFPEIIAGLTIRFVTFMARLYEKANYISMVDVGIVLTGLKGSVVNLHDYEMQPSYPPYDRDDYKKSSRFTALQMLEDPMHSSKYLVVPFMKAISQDRIDPFKQK